MSQLQEDIKSKVIEWNRKFPLDYWWRKKYNVPFGSEQHKAMNYMDIMFDFEEQRLFAEWKERKDDLDENGEDESPVLTSKHKEIKMTKKEEQDMFDNLKLDDFNNEVETIETE